MAYDWSNDGTWKPPSQRTAAEQAAYNAEQQAKYDASGSGYTYDPDAGAIVNSMRQQEALKDTGAFVYNRTSPMTYAQQYNAWAEKNGEPTLGTTSPGVGGDTYTKDGVLLSGPDGKPAGAQIGGVTDLPQDVIDNFNPWADGDAPPFQGPVQEVPDWYKPFEPAAPVEQSPVNMPNMFERSPENSEWTGPYIPGVPGNPIPGPKGGDFSPFGSPIGKLSDSKVFGGLPRSTGPFGISGGYYGGNPYTGQENPLMAAQAAALRGG